MALSQDAVKEIRLALQDADAIQDSFEALNLNAGRVKDKIRSMFTSKVHQMRVREQWLLNQVEQLHQCLFNVLQSNGDNVTECRGKLKACLDILECCEENEISEVGNYVEDILERFNEHLSQLNCSPTIEFEYDDARLSEVIRKFGSVRKTADDSLSEASWEFPGSETQCTTSECGETIPEKDDSVSAKKNCCGSCDTNTAFEIEDLDKYFSSAASVAIKEVCRANETCCNFDECLCDQKCYLIASENSETEAYNNEYVDAIGESFFAVASQSKAAEMFVSSDAWVESTDTASILSNFSSRVASIEEEFMQIMCGVYTPIHLPQKPVSTSPWSMEQVSFEIDQILQEHDQIVSTCQSSNPVEIVSAAIDDILSQKKSTTIYNPSYSTCGSQNVAQSSPSHFSELTSQLDAILNGEMPMIGVDTDTDIKENKSESVNDYQEKFSLSLKSKDRALYNKYDFEKDDFAEEKYIKDSNPKKWSTIEDVQDILGAILN